MKRTIITAPHDSLRQTAQAVTSVTPEISQLTQDLGETLLKKKEPQGVGLAAPQIDHQWRMFALHVDLENDMEAKPSLTVMINPEITKSSQHLTFGPDEDHPTLEGCLSIPGIYGAVPRHEWVRVAYQQLIDGSLVSYERRFDWFAARVIQHELDHLNGILFTDYSLQYDLPVYQENPKNKKLYEIDSTIIEVL